MYKVGDLVRYIREDSEEDKATGFYPPIGTIGRVIGKEEITDCLIVDWPEGTTTKGGGYVQDTDVEGVVNYDGWVLAGMFDDFAQCPKCGQHEYPLSMACEWTFCPYCGERIKYEGELK